MKKILIISARNFGDSVIIVNLLKQINYDRFSVDILTRKEFVPIFNQVGNISNIYTSNFPMGTMKNFNFDSATKLFSVIKILRKENYDIALNNIGDFRENLLGWLIKPKKNISIKWHKTHPFINLIKVGPSFFVDKYIDIPNKTLNIYDVQKFIVNNISIAQNKAVFNREQRKVSKIAIHPMASQKSRFWNYSNWTEVIKKTGSLENRIIIFCAPNEVLEIERELTEVLDKIEIVAKNITFFLNKLKEIDLFIGLDSFSIHSAYMMNVPNLIMLNGANDFRVWAPPKTKVLEGGKNCEYFPCYNKPKCIGKDFEYICMSSINPEEVINTIEEIQNAANDKE